MAPPGRAGRARRKLGREAGGGAATLSHAGLTRPPLPGAEVTAGLGEAVVAARCAKGPPGGGELVRGRAGPGEAGRGARVAVRGRRAEGTRAPRNAGRPGLRRPCPATAAAPAGSPRGAAGRRALVGVLRSRSVGPREVPGSWRPGGRQSEGCRRGLFKWCQASPGLFSLHHPATPAMRRNLKAGKESSVSPAPLFNR